MPIRIRTAPAVVTLTLALTTGLTAAPASAGEVIAPRAAATQVKPWEKLPATPAPVKGTKAGYATVNGARLFYRQIGSGSPVILLHGGPDNSTYFGHQVNALKRNHRVILVDTRGHGRSTRDAKPLGYDLFADDVVALMARLKVKRADFLGWSDGGITALDVAMRYPEKVRRVVAFGANTSTKGVLPHPDRKPAFRSFLARAEAEYRKLSPTPGGFAGLNDALGAMYATQPQWTNAQLRSIRARVLIMDGAHDEAISQRHTRAIARTIPNATLRVLPNTSHFAFLQDPKRFNKEVVNFLR